MIIGFFIIVEWLQRNEQHGLEISKNLTEDEKDKFLFLRWSFYVILILMIYFLGNFDTDIEFIYFQF